MSIFPKRNSPGNTLVIHIALLQQENSSSQKKLNIRVVPPSGRIFEFYDKEIFLFPKGTKRGSDINTNLLNIYNLHPAFLFSDYAQKVINNCDSNLISVNHRLATSKHMFLPFEIKDNAELGKYQVLLEVKENGVTKSSLTNASDYFFEENIRIERVEKNDDKYGITLVNSSIESTPVRVCMDDGEPTETILILKGNERKTINNLTRNTYIIYANDSIILPIVEDIHVYRNPDIRFVVQADEVYAWHDDDEYQGCKLTGLSKDLWCSLDSLRTKSEILTTYDQHLYNDMLNNNLIKEANDLLEKV